METMNHKTCKKGSSARSVSIARPTLAVHRLPNEETRCRAVGLTAPSQTYALLIPCYLQARLLNWDLATTTNKTKRNLNFAFKTEFCRLYSDSSRGSTPASKYHPFRKS
jgi:hypothetical protein